MLKKTLCAALLLITQISWGQTKQDFEKSGRDLFHQITDMSFEGYVPFIRIKEYRQLIAQQPISEQEKRILQMETDAAYSSLYENWQESMKNLRRTYSKEARQGASYEYLTTRYFPSEKLVDTYEVETSFIYRNEDVQNEVVLSYEAAWVKNDLVLITPLKETF